MSQQDPKKYTTEWSFEFAKISGQIADWAKSVGIGDEEAVKRSQYAAPLDDAASARMTLEFAVGQAVIHPISSDQLIEADLTHVGTVGFTVGGEGAARTVHLHQSAQPADWMRNVVGWIGSGQKLRWDVGLTTRLPLDLTVRGGAGRGDFNLHELNVSALHLNTGVGETMIILPAPPHAYSARIDCGVGRVELVVPHSAQAELEIAAGTGEVVLEIGEAAQVRAKISGGVGPIRVRLPQEVPARLEAQRGIGGISVPPELLHVEEAGTVWQTADYDPAAGITLSYRGGVGPLEIVR